MGRGLVWGENEHTVSRLLYFRTQQSADSHSFIPCLWCDSGGNFEAAHRHPSRVVEDGSAFSKVEVPRANIYFREYQSVSFFLRYTPQNERSRNEYVGEDFSRRFVGRSPSLILWRNIKDIWYMSHRIANRSFPIEYYIRSLFLALNYLRLLAKKFF